MFLRLGALVRLRKGVNLPLKIDATLRRREGLPKGRGPLRRRGLPRLRGRLGVEVCLGVGSYS